ncbi:PBSX family phage terminase large subunit [Arsenophonus nasoniae]|uniref:PBSX family phage terminase large subunit n=1 Tax=Arsenophonus nasoniae TaxID=638 RepID=UPI003879040C
MDKKVSLQLPEKLATIFACEGVRYRCAYGGRGSGKSYNFALMTAVKAYQLSSMGKRGIILCAREFENTIRESSLSEVKKAIRSLTWLEEHFEIGDKYIKTKDKRITYDFSGLHHNLNSIKSKSQILLAWIDEAETVSEQAWQKLIPTVREEGSEIWVTWNPERKGSSTDIRFRQEKSDNCISVEINHNDNPWFPEVSEIDRQNDKKRLDDNTYLHIWEGAYLENSDKQVLHGKYEIKSFPDDLWEKANRLFFGADFGFSNDPSTLIRSFILDECLYIEYEAWGVGIELDELPNFYQKIPESKRWEIKADNSRPETISYLQRQGFRIKAASKGKDSVQDGIVYLRSFRKIYIHPRCTHSIEEARLYSYKTDKNTGEILPIIVDAYNHCWDAVRYSLESYVKGSVSFLDTMW